MCVSCSVVSNSLQTHGLYPTRLLCSQNSPGKHIGVGCRFLLQGIFLTQGSNLGLLHCEQILYHLSHQGNPAIVLRILIKNCSVTKSHTALCNPMNMHTNFFCTLSCTLTCTLSSRVCSNSFPLSQWWYLAISSSATSSFCLQSFPTSDSSLMSWPFTSGGRSIGASASATVLPMNIQGSFPLVLTDLTSLQSKGLSRVFSSTTIWKHQFFGIQLSLWSSNSHIRIRLLEKIIALTIQTFVCKVISLLFNMLSRFVIAFLPRSKHLLISWLQKEFYC